MSRELAVILETGGSCNLPPEMDPKDEGLIFGVSLLAANMLLEDVAEDIGVTPLSAFMKEESYEDEESDDAPVWYDPKQGLETVAKLLSYLLAHPEVDKSPEGVYRVLWDLRALELILRDAVNENDRFYFAEW